MSSAIALEVVFVADKVRTSVSSISITTLFKQNKTHDDLRIPRKDDWSCAFFSKVF